MIGASRSEILMHDTRPNEANTIQERVSIEASIFKTALWNEQYGFETALFLVQIGSIQKVFRRHRQDDD